MTKGVWVAKKQRREREPGEDDVTKNDKAKKQENGCNG